MPPAPAGSRFGLTKLYFHRIYSGALRLDSGVGRRFFFVAFHQFAGRGRRGTGAFAVFIRLPRHRAESPDYHLREVPHCHRAQPGFFMRFQTMR